MQRYNFFDKHKNFSQKYRTTRIALDGNDSHFLNESDDFTNLAFFCLSPLHFPHFPHSGAEAENAPLCGKCRKCNRPIPLFILLLIGTVLDMPEEITLQPVLESPFAHLMALRNLHALAGLKGNWQLIINGQLLLRQS